MADTREELAEALRLGALACAKAAADRPEAAPSGAEHLASAARTLTEAYKLVARSGSASF